MFICINISSPAEDESINTDEASSGEHNKDSKSEDGDAELTEECEGKSENRVPGKNKRAANTIAGDKAAKRRSLKVSNMQAALQSSESLTSAIRDMSNAQDERRKNYLLLWIEHEARERKKDRELQKLKIESKERENQRKYELELMKMRMQTGFTQLQQTFATPGTSGHESAFTNQGQYGPGVANQYDSTSYYNFLYIYNGYYC